MRLVPRSAAATAAAAASCVCPCRRMAWILVTVVLLVAVLASLLLPSSLFSLSTVWLHPSRSQVQALRAQSHKAAAPAQVTTTINLPQTKDDAAIAAKAKNADDVFPRHPIVPKNRTAHTNDRMKRACRPGRDAGCKCPDHCHECQVGSWMCTMCRDGRYLHQGQCVDECPVTHFPIGRGNYGKYCGKEVDAQRKGVSEADVLLMLREKHQQKRQQQEEEQKGASQQQQQQEHQQQQQQQQQCQCDDCVGKTCICHADGSHHCMLCKNFKFLLDGKCIDECPSTGAYTPVGTSRFGRKCKLRSRAEHPPADTRFGSLDDRAVRPHSKLERPLDSEHAKEEIKRAGEPQLHEVVWGIERDQIEAATVHINIGDTVRWVMDGQHSVVSGRPGQHDNQFYSGPPGSKPVFEHIFTKPGVYPYHCRSHSGRMQARIIVGGVADQQEGSWHFLLMYEGAGGKTAHPQRFETAMKQAFTVFRQADMSLEECKARCARDTKCRGIFYYRASRRCKGLSSLGTAGVPTEIKADSYAKVHSMDPIQSIH